MFLKENYEFNFGRIPFKICTNQLKLKVLLITTLTINSTSFLEIKLPSPLMLLQTDTTTLSQTEISPTHPISTPHTPDPQN